MNEDHKRCRCCGSGALTVQEAKQSTSPEKCRAVADAMRFRPVASLSRREVVLVDTKTKAPVLSWTADQAFELLAELLSGPYFASLCLGTPKHGVVEFCEDEAVALATSLHIAAHLVAATA